MTKTHDPTRSSAADALAHKAEYGARHAYAIGYEDGRRAEQARADAAERARDELGIQLAAAQAEIARLRKAVDDVRVLRDVGVMPDRVARALDQVFAALDTVPGDALAIDTSNVKGVE